MGNENFVLYNHQKLSKKDTLQIHVITKVERIFNGKEENFKVVIIAFLDILEVQNKIEV